MDLSSLAIPILFLSGLPQTLKLLKTKSSQDISLITYCLTSVGIGLILTDASGGVFWSNLTSFLMVNTNLILAIYYRRKRFVN